MVSIKQQMYNALVATVTGVTWYGSDDDTDRMMPPPVDAPTPWGYLRFNDEFMATPNDPRAMVQVRIGDDERRQYTRINQKLALCDQVFARNPATEYIDVATGEIWYFPEPGGWTPESEDFDRPGMLVRIAEYMFRKRIKPVVIAQV